MAAFETSEERSAALILKSFTFCCGRFTSADAKTDSGCKSPSDSSGIDSTDGD